MDGKDTDREDRRVEKRRRESQDARWRAGLASLRNHIGANPRIRSRYVQRKEGWERRRSKRKGWSAEEEDGAVVCTVDAVVSEGRRRDGGKKGRAIEEGGLNEKKKSHPPPEGARRRCDDRSPRDAAAAKTPRPSRFCWRSPSSPTCSCGLSSSSLNDSISLRYNHDVIIDFAMNDRVTTHVSQTRSI